MPSNVVPLHRDDGRPAATIANVPAAAWLTAIARKYPNITITHEELTAADNGTTPAMAWNGHGWRISETPATPRAHARD